MRPAGGGMVLVEPKAGAVGCLKTGSGALAGWLGMGSGAALWARVGFHVGNRFHGR